MSEENSGKQSIDNAKLVEMEKKFIYPKMNSYVEPMNYNFWDFKLSDFNPKQLLENANSKDDWKKKKEETVISLEDVKKNFVKVYGPDVKMPEPDVVNNLGGVACLAMAEYYKTSKEFRVFVCERDPNGYTIISESKIAKIEEKGNDIYVYKYFIYGVVDKTNNVNHYFNKYPSIEKAYSVKDNVVTLITALGKGTNIQEDMQKFLDKKQLNQYKFTFTKQSDDNYYFTSGELVE